MHHALGCLLVTGRGPAWGAGTHAYSMTQTVWGGWVERAHHCCVCLLVGALPRAPACCPARQRVALLAGRVATP